MKFRIFTLIFLLYALLGIAGADDRLYFYIECSLGRQCIDFAYPNGKAQSVSATPVQVLGRADIKSASVQMGEGASPSLKIELNKDASRMFEKITGENIGKKLVVVLNSRILTAPIINMPIADPNIMISSGEPFWERVPWLQDLIKESFKAGGRPIMIYVGIALAASISALAFVLLPRRRRTRQPSPE